jgi:hypothetical protein
MVLLDPLSFKSSAFTYQIAESNISMGSLDTRRPVSMKYCDLLSPYIRFSAMDVLLNNPSIVSGTALSNVDFVQTGMFSMSNCGVLNSNVNTIDYTKLPTSSCNYTDACVSVKNVAGGNGGWYNGGVAIGGSNGMTVTVAAQLTSSSNDDLIQLKGYDSNGTTFGDALVMKSSQFWVSRYPDRSNLGAWPNTSFTLSNGKKTTMSMRFTTNVIETYQDGLLKATYSNTGYDYKFWHYATVLAPTSAAGMKFYEVMVHDFSLDSNQISKLHSAISRTYLWQ